MQTQTQPMFDYLAEINSPEGIFLWMCMLVSFLLGFLIAYLLRTGKVRRLKKEVRHLTEAEKAAVVQLDATREQLKERNEELQEASREKVEFMERARTLSSQQGSNPEEVLALNQQVEALQATNRNYEQMLNEQKQEIATLYEERDRRITTSQGVGTDATEVTLLRERLNSFEASLGRLSGENDLLKAEVSQLKQHSHGTAQQDTPVVLPATDISPEPELQIQSEKTVLYDKIIVADREKDDLSKIEGLGSFLQTKLNNIGVFTYAEIAAWTPERINEITTAIGFIPGRIQKDDWVGQAARLLQAQNNAPAAMEHPQATVAVAKPKKKKKKAEAASAGNDDLKRIEGIGPKIEAVLNEAGIHSWAALAATEPGRLRELLEEAGGRFRMHNPYTWPLQARLAAAGRWEELEKYQEELKGGKE